MLSNCCLHSSTEAEVWCSNFCLTSLYLPVNHKSLTKTGWWVSESIELHSFASISFVFDRREPRREEEKGGFITCHATVLCRSKTLALVWAWKVNIHERLSRSFLHRQSESSGIGKGQGAKRGQKKASVVIIFAIFV